MEIQGRVIEVMPIQSGVGKNSGREWSSQEFIIEYNENTQYPRNACLRIFGADRIAEINIQQGEYVNVNFDVESSKYMERWYTRLNAYRVTRIQPGAYQPQNNQGYAMQDIPPVSINDAPMSVQRQVNNQMYGGDYQQQQQYYQPAAPQYQPAAAPQQMPPMPADPAQPASESNKYDSDLPF